MNMTLQGSWTANEPNPFYSDTWGFTDTLGNEYAIVGTKPNIYFIDVTDPTQPTEILSHPGGSSSIWRDFKTYKNYAYGVADQGNEGLLIFDMSGLPSNPPTLVNQLADFDRAHNIFIDVPNGLAYVVGSNVAGSGALVYNLKNDPVNPSIVFSNSLSGGYVHDIYVRDNIAYASHGNNGFYMYDFTNPSSPQFIDSRFTGGYNHSSWLTDDGLYSIYAEEVPSGRPLGILNLSDVPNNGIQLVRTFKFPLLAPQTGSTPHNPFIVGDYCIVSYYEDGVQIFDISDKNNPFTAAYYDTAPNNTNYNGTTHNWGVYPFFPSGTIVATDTKNGLFVLSTTVNIPTTCFDGIQNGTELGVDCGGYCRPCPQTLFANFSVDTTYSCTGEISFQDNSLGNITDWYWEFGDGNTSTQQNPVHTYALSDTFTVTLRISNAAEADKLIKTQHIVISRLIPPAVFEGTFCAPDVTTLTAFAPAGQINWYDNTGNYLATGSSYTTPVLNDSTTYFAELETITTQFFGPLNSSIGGGEYHNTSAKYLEFTVTEELTLVSTWVDSNQPGNRTIELRDGNGNLINSITLNIPNGTSRIPLNLDLAPGNYQIGGDNMNLFRNNSGVSYPYTISNLIEITSSTNGSGHYYYFYDWEVKSTECSSAKVPVLAAKIPVPESNFDFLITDKTVAFTDLSRNTTSWIWDFGDGNTSTQQNPTHTYTANGTYQVTLTSINVCDSILSTATIVVPQLKVNLTVFLEGTFDAGLLEMNSNLSTRSLFPTTGQPYTGTPWNYPGTEGSNWLPADYPTNAVDWVLISLRSGEDNSTTVGTAAGLLDAMGGVTVNILPTSGVLLSEYYIVVEHRNHIPVMSPTKIQVVNNELTHNFSTANSYTSGPGFGQKQVGSTWLMYAGNGDHQNPVGHEITGADILEWQFLNGTFNQYQMSDFSLDGDVNAFDKLLWSYNNGIFSSVPK